MNGLRNATGLILFGLAALAMSAARPDASTADTSYEPETVAPVADTAAPSADCNCVDCDCAVCQCSTPVAVKPTLPAELSAPGFVLPTDPQPETAIAYAPAGIVCENGVCRRVESRGTVQAYASGSCANGACATSSTGYASRSEYRGPVRRVFGRVFSRRPVRGLLGRVFGGRLRGGCG